MMELPISWFVLNILSVEINTFIPFKIIAVGFFSNSIKNSFISKVNINAIFEYAALIKR